MKDDTYTSYYQDNGATIIMGEMLTYREAVLLYRKALDTMGVILVMVSSRIWGK
jgi:hypothetical protein